MSKDSWRTEVTEGAQQSWARPVPVIGDATSARTRREDPGGWAMGAPVGEALEAVVGAGRDIRRFRPDPVPADLLEAVLAAGHRAPSVGHSQPWRFIVVSDQQRPRIPSATWGGLVVANEILHHASGLSWTLCNEATNKNVW